MLQTIWNFVDHVVDSLQLCRLCWGRETMYLPHIQICCADGAFQELYKTIIFVFVVACNMRVTFVVAEQPTVGVLRTQKLWSPLLSAQISLRLSL